MHKNKLVDCLWPLHGSLRQKPSDPGSNPANIPQHAKRYESPGSIPGPRIAPTTTDSGWSCGGWPGASLEPRTSGRAPTSPSSSDAATSSRTTSSSIPWSRSPPSRTSKVRKLVIEQSSNSNCIKFRTGYWSFFYPIWAHWASFAPGSTARHPFFSSTTLDEQTSSKRDYGRLVNIGFKLLVIAHTFCFCPLS